MTRTKNLNQGKDKDGKHRKETKEERRARLQSQEDAREVCCVAFMYGIGVCAMRFLLACDTLLGTSAHMISL
jgi:hypothetical protein